MSDEKLRDRRKAAIAEDNPEWTEADFARAKPASEALGPDAAALLVRPRGRPTKAPGERKRQVTMRIAPDLLEEMRSSGPGWQARAEAILRREFIDDDVEAVAAAMRSSLERRDMVDIQFDEQVRRGFQIRSSLIIRLALEKLKAENYAAMNRPTVREWQARVEMAMHGDAPGGDTIVKAPIKGRMVTVAELASRAVEAVKVKKGIKSASSFATARSAKAGRIIGGGRSTRKGDGKKRA